MFKIHYSKESLLKIDSFCYSYKDIFKRLFKDSGLIAEDEIINNYIKTEDIFQNLIIA